jgi:hypothetical protein
MKKRFKAAGRKRPVNPTLNEDPVNKAMAMTDNRSDERPARVEVLEAAVAAWNRFNSDSGSIADEYSSL